MGPDWLFGQGSVRKVDTGEAEPPELLSFTQAEGSGATREVLRESGGEASLSGLKFDFFFFLVKELLCKWGSVEVAFLQCEHMQGHGSGAAQRSDRERLWLD